MSTLHHPGIIEVGAVWFAGQGFRPAVEIPPHRVDHVDPARLVPAPDADAAYLGKYDLPVTLDAAEEGDGFGFVLWPADSPQITAASLAGPGHVASTSFYGATPLLPPSSEPRAPCCIIREPDMPPPPMPAPVPVEASTAALLLCAVGLLFARRIWSARNTWRKP